MSYKSIGEVLELSRPTNTLQDLMAIVREGVFKTTIDKLARLLKISPRELTTYLHISERTLQRYESDKKLSPELTDHLIQIAKVYTKAVEIFEDKDNAVEWLKYPSIPLGNATPLSCLDNSSGFELVMDELSRIDYGVYA